MCGPKVELRRCKMLYTASLSLSSWFRVFLLLVHRSLRERERERENWNVGSNGEHQSSKDYDSTYRTCIFSVSSIYCFNLIFPFVVFCRRRIQNLIFRFLQSVSSLITPSMLIRVGLLCSDSCSLSLSMWCRKLGSRFGFLSRKIWGLKEESL